MMHRTIAVLLAAAASCNGALADVSISPGPPPPYLEQRITVRNESGADVRFVRSSEPCISEAPDSFTVAAKATETITVKWTFATVYCYALNHITRYAEAGKSANYFRVATYYSSNDGACLQLWVFEVGNVGHAVCPEFGGTIVGAESNTGNGGFVKCPAGVPACPPHDSGGSQSLTNGTEYFGFVVRGGAGLELGPPAPVAVVEYYNAALDRYLVTWRAREIALLDEGKAFKGWLRTGNVFNAWPVAPAGAATVCRFHAMPSRDIAQLLGRDARECDDMAQRFPGFVLEDAEFLGVDLPAAGACPASTRPVYRLFNNRPEPNHRYVTNRALRDQMVGQGWLAEGDGPDGVALCAPP